MNDDVKFAAMVVAASIIGALLVLLIGWGVRTASAAALFDINGQKVVVMAPDELVRLMAAKDAEIITLRDRLDGRTKIECNLI